MRVLAIDPGTTKSGWCLLEDGAPTDWGWDDNENLLMVIKGGRVFTTPASDFNRLSQVLGGTGDRWHFVPVPLVIEDIGNYGTAVGRDTFETVRWTGRFQQAHDGQTTYILRPTIKTHLCGVASAKDGNVRQALIDRYGGDEVAVGGKKCQTCKGKGWVGRDHDPCGDCHCDLGALNNNDNCGYSTHPGPLKGISGHAWSALAVGVTYLDQQP